MKFKAVIFDLDGTLVNSIQDLADSINFSFSSQGLDTLSLDIVKKNLGNGIDRLIVDSLPEKYRTNKKFIARTLELMAQKYSVAWKNNTCLYEEIPNLLDSLMIKQIPMAIVSNKPEPFLHEIVEFLMKKWEFIAVVGGKPQVPLKPNPQSTLEIIKKSKILAEDICFVGDGDADIKMALAAGVTPIAVTWGFRSMQEQKQVGANVFINNPLELLQYT